jgi:hypothetical protein
VRLDADRERLQVAADVFGVVQPLL